MQQLCPCRHTHTQAQMYKFLERQLPVSLQEAGDFGMKRGCHSTSPLVHIEADVRLCERSAAREQGDLAAVSCFTQSGHRGSLSKSNHSLFMCV